MKIYIKSSNVLSDNKRVAVIEEYLRKYDKGYLAHKNKAYRVLQVMKEFETGDNPFRRNSSEYNDSMAQVWESYRRKVLKGYNP